MQLNHRAPLVVSLLAISAQFVIAQDIPYVKKGDFEVGLFAGESYGLDRFRPMAGANIAYALSRTFFPFAEASYLPGIRRTAPVSTGSTISRREYTVNMTDVHAGLHIRHPKAESRLVPYGVIGLGVVRSGRQSGTLFLRSDFGPLPGEPFEIPSSVNFAVDFGGGLRYFFTQKVAVRIEFKGLKPTSAPPGLEPNLFYRFAIGPIFQLR